MRLLACLALLSLASVASAQTRMINGWGVDTRVDPITDRRMVVAVSENADDPGNDDVVLGIICQRGSYIIGFTHTYLIGDDDHKARYTYRFDSTPSIGPVPLDLRPNGRSSAPYGSDTVRSADFVRRALASRRVVLRLTDPFDGETITSTISLVGFDEVVEALGCPAP